MIKKFEEFTGGFKQINENFFESQPAMKDLNLFKKIATAVNGYIKKMNYNKDICYSDVQGDGTYSVGLFLPEIMDVPILDVVDGTLHGGNGETHPFIDIKNVSLCPDHIYVRYGINGPYIEFDFNMHEYDEHDKIMDFAFTRLENIKNQDAIEDIVNNLM